VIARDVHLEGNIASSSPVYVYGSVRGDIDVKESLVNVMREGRVEGNINCQQLIIDGAVTGQCTGDAVDIAENGTLTGTLAYRTLSINRAAPLPARQNCVPHGQNRRTLWGWCSTPPRRAQAKRLRENAGKKASTRLAKNTGSNVSNVVLSGLPHRFPERMAIIIIIIRTCLPFLQKMAVDALCKVVMLKRIFH
jgi:cytoskeletal protein CcmA (bactofilin family)